MIILEGVDCTPLRYMLDWASNTVRQSGFLSRSLKQKTLKRNNKRSGHHQHRKEIITTSTNIRRKPSTIKRMSDKECQQTLTRIPRATSMRHQETVHQTFIPAIISKYKRLLRISETIRTTADIAIHLKLQSNYLLKQHSIIESRNMNSFEIPETLPVALKEELPKVHFTEDYFEMSLSAVGLVRNIAGIYQILYPSVNV